MTPVDLMETNNLLRRIAEGLEKGLKVRESARTSVSIGPGMFGDFGTVADGPDGTTGMARLAAIAHLLRAGVEVAARNGERLPVDALGGLRLDFAPVQFTDAGGVRVVEAEGVRMRIKVFAYHLILTADQALTFASVDRRYANEPDKWMLGTGLMEAVELRHAVPPPAYFFATAPGHDLYLATSKEGPVGGFLSFFREA